MKTEDEYIRVARLDDLRHKGWRKVTLFGRQLMIFYRDGEGYALDMESVSDEHGLSLPAEFHRASSNLLNLLAGSPGRGWGELTAYPVRIVDEYFCVKPSPLQ